jgi:hypothetical protein
MSMMERLAAEIAKDKYRIEKSISERQERKRMQKNLNEVRSDMTLVKSLISTYRKMIKDIIEYQAEYQSDSINDVHRAIYAAKSIIPDCGEIAPVIEAGSFIIVDESGLNIKDIEGDGLKSTVSTMVRHSILSRTAFQQFMILDESLAPVNDVNSATFSKYLPLLAKDMLIILIEQKPSVFDNAGKIQNFRVSKENGISTVGEEKLDDVIA